MNAETKILLALIALFSVGGAASLWLNQPPVITAISVGLVTTTCLYRFLGGVEGSTFKMATFKASGSVAVCCIAVWYVNGQLVALNSTVQPAPADWVAMDRTGAPVDIRIGQDSLISDPSVLADAVWSAASVAGTFRVAAGDETLARIDPASLGSVGLFNQVRMPSGRAIQFTEELAVGMEDDLFPTVPIPNPRHRLSGRLQWLFDPEPERLGRRRRRAHHEEFQGLRVQRPVLCGFRGPGRPQRSRKGTVGGLRVRAARAKHREPAGVTPMPPCGVPRASDIGDPIESGQKEAPRCRVGREAARALGSRRMRCGLVGSLQRLRSGFGLWFAVGIAIQQVDHRPLLAQASPPSSSGTNVVEIAVSGSAASGSSSFAIVDARLTFERLDSVYYELVASVHGRYGQSNGELITKNWGAEASFDATPQADFSLFSFADLEQNSIRKLTLRSRMGAGAKWLLMRKSNEDKTSFSAALLSAYEKHQIDVEEPGTSTWRWSVRLKRDLAVASKIDLSTAWFLQPRIDALEDYLVDGIVQISQQLTERVRLTFTFDYFHDSDPPAGIEESEQRFLFGVTGRF